MTTDPFRLLFQDSPLLALRIDESLACRDLTAAWRERLPTQTAHQAVIPLTELLDFENHAALAALVDVFQSGTPVVDTPVSLRAASGLRRALASAWRAHSTTDSPDCVIVLVTDLGEFERERTEHSRLQQQHELILVAAGEGIYGLDREGRITFGNKAAERIVGWRTADMLGRISHDVHHHSHPDGTHYPREQCPIYAALKDGQVHTVDDEVFWHSDGTAIPVEYTSTPIMAGGAPIGAVVVFRDVTHRKELEKRRQADFEEIRRLKEELEQERDYLRAEVNTAANYGEIIGHSPALMRALAQIEVVTKTPLSVLVLGESGVGKEMIARAIHAGSHRANKPLVKVNCASISKDLFESEFFGHVRGAFTGAHKDRTGRLQLADGGTLFLDEIGEIPMSQQGKLLRALQEGEFERVGDDRTIKVDLRLVAATNRPLLDEVRAGRFREDLYYRISVFPVEVPPLRERVDDIGPLALHFLKSICRELGRESPRITQRQLADLQRYSWPGNIRELKNVIERAVISSSSAHLRLDLALPVATSDNRLPNAQPDAEPTAVLTAAEFRALERVNLIGALRQANWKISGPGGAADRLGMKPSTLTYQMKALEIVIDELRT